MESQKNRKEFVPEQLNRVRHELRDELEGIIGKKELNEFKKFAFKQNMIEMAIAFMLGGAFKGVVGSISSNVIMPIINYALAKAGTDWRAIKWTPLEGMEIEIGKFCGAFVDFILISVILYLLFRKFISPIMKDEVAEKIKCIETVECSWCFSKIDYRCKRCPNCTSLVEW